MKTGIEAGCHPITPNPAHFRPIAPNRALWSSAWTQSCAIVIRLNSIVRHCLPIAPNPACCHPIDQIVHAAVLLSYIVSSCMSKPPIALYVPRGPSAFVSPCLSHWIIPQYANLCNVGLRAGISYAHRNNPCQQLSHFLAMPMLNCGIYDHCVELNLEGMAW